MFHQYSSEKNIHFFKMANLFVDKVDPTILPPVQVDSASLKKQKGQVSKAKLSVRQARSERLKPDREFWKQDAALIWTTDNKKLAKIRQREKAFKESEHYVPPPATVVSAAALRKRMSRKKLALAKEAKALEDALDSGPEIEVPSVALPKFRLVNRAPGPGKGRRDRQRKRPSKAEASAVSGAPPVPWVRPQRERCAYCPSHFALRKNLTYHIRTKHPILPVLFTGESLPTIRRRTGEAKAPVSRRALDKAAGCQAAVTLPTVAPPKLYFNGFIPAERLCLETKLAKGHASSAGDINEACERSPEFATLFKRLLDRFADRNWAVHKLRENARRLIRRHFA